MRPRPDNQAALDTTLARADQASRKRFADSLTAARPTAGSANTRPRSITTPSATQALPRSPAEPPPPKQHAGSAG